MLHPVSDLATAKAAYTALLGVPPQTDESYYVGFLRGHTRRPPRRPPHPHRRAPRGLRRHPTEALADAVRRGLSSVSTRPTRGPISDAVPATSAGTCCASVGCGWSMPGTKNPTAPQSANTTPARRAYPTMTIPAEIAHRSTRRRGSEGIGTVISRTLRKTGERRSSGPVRAVVQEWSCRPRQGARRHDRGGDRRTETLQAIAA